MNMKAHQELEKVLRKTRLECVPAGVHNIKEIYAFVKESYPELCNDNVCCKDICSCGANQPEWKHRVRTVLSAMKGKCVDKNGLERGMWRLSVKSTYNGMMKMSHQLMVLDPCCSSRSMWFPSNKENPYVLYMDRRIEKKGQTTSKNGIWPIELQKGWNCDPDMIGDYRNLPFDDETFYHIVWDPPHLIRNTSGIISMKYGHLGEEWSKDLAEAFNELWRVLRLWGTMVLKWNSIDIGLKEVTSKFPIEPQYGTRSKKGVV